MAEKEFQKRGGFTDLTLICEGERFPVERAVVCPQSAVLDTACRRIFTDEPSGVFEMIEVAPSMVQKMVDFFYDGSYCTSIQEEDEDGPVSDLQVHTRMFALGDMYDVPALREFAVERFSRTLSSSTDLEVLESVPDVYELVPEAVNTLWGVLCGFVRLHIEQYLKDAETREVFESITAEVPEFAADVLYVCL
ncbi:hypothetical protein FQN54_006477 [Arachnomyces sp. PD_36]|nr:hypothetical protein FQN54_006477 [Arachnomyces sp. PD_36]